MLFSNEQCLMQPILSRVLYYRHYALCSLFSLEFYLILPLFFLLQPILTWFLFMNNYLQALALLSEFIEKDDTIIKIGAILGLGIASAGTNKDEVEYYPP